MYDKLKDFFAIAKIIFKGLFTFFEHLGLDVSKAYELSRDIDNIGDDLLADDSPLKNYIN